MWSTRERRVLETIKELRETRLQKSERKVVRLQSGDSYVGDEQVEEEAGFRETVNLEEKAAASECEPEKR